MRNTAGKSAIPAVFLATLCILPVWTTSGVYSVEPEPSRQGPAEKAKPDAQPAAPRQQDAQKPVYGLDKEFYNAYLDSLPNERVESEATLSSNMLRIARRLIPREDSRDGPAFVRTLSAQSLQIVKVSESSPFVRGIFRELPYLRTTPYMYIVKAGPYLLFLTFRVDPKAFVTSEFQSRTVKQAQQETHP